MANTSNPDIIYTKVDEAPELASASLLPIIQRFASAAGISVGTKDISLAGRILSRFPESLSEAQCIDDHLSGQSSFTGGQFGSARGGGCEKIRSKQSAPDGRLVGGE